MTHRIVNITHYAKPIFYNNKQMVAASRPYGIMHKVSSQRLVKEPSKQILQSAVGTTIIGLTSLCFLLKFNVFDVKTQLRNASKKIELELRQMDRRQRVEFAGQKIRKTEK